MSTSAKCTTADACACVGLCTRSLECPPAHSKRGPSNTSRFREFDFEVGSDERVEAAWLSPKEIPIRDQEHPSLDRTPESTRNHLTFAASPKRHGVPLLSCPPRKAISSQSLKP